MSRFIGQFLLDMMKSLISAKSRFPVPETALAAENREPNPFFMIYS